MGDRQSSPEAEEPEKAPEEPAKAAEEPAKAAEEPAKAAEEPAKAAEEPAKAEEPPPPGDPKKEWPIALAIMVFIALMSWAFISMLRPG